MFGFECDCSVDHDSGPRVSLARMVRARKPHECEECGRAIQPGETYERTTGNWDGRWHTYNTCLGCLRIRKRFCSGGWIYGEVAEQVAQCLGFRYDDDPEDWDQSVVDAEDEANRARVRSAGSKGGG